MLKADDATGLALLYHLNSEPWMNQAAYAAAARGPHFLRPTPGEAQVSLPSQGERSALMRLLARRRSCRSFAPGRLPLSALSDLLQGAYGVFDGEERDVGCARPAPSAGALHPFEILIASRGVEGIEDGLYCYDGLHHRLTLLRTGAVFEEICRVILTGAFLENANLIIVLTAAIMRTCGKYGPRGYRYMLLEAGHVAQNLCLLAAERELGALCVGGFFDSSLNHALDLDGYSKAAVYCVSVGQIASDG